MEKPNYKMQSCMKAGVEITRGMTTGIAAFPPIRISAALESFIHDIYDRCEDELTLDEVERIAI